MCYYLMVMSDGIVSQKISILSELLIFQSNLFHSIFVEEKKVFLEVVFHTNCKNFIMLPFLYDILCAKIIEYRYFGDCDSIFCRNSKVSSTNVVVEESSN